MQHDNIQKIVAKGGFTQVKCSENHFLPSDSYLANGDPTHGACDLGSTSQMLAYAPHTRVPQVGVYMDLIRLRVHHEANLLQAQRNLMGTNKCEWRVDPGWFP